MEDYVAVGMSPEYSVTVDKSTFDTGFILFTLIFCLLLIIFVGVVMIVAINESAPKTIPRVIVIGPTQPNLNSNIGAAPYAKYSLNKNLILPEDGSAFTTQQQCLSNCNTEWKDGKCECIAPFYGPRCMNEKHQKKYYSVGIVDESVIETQVLRKTMSNGKSFNSDNNNNSCSKLCDTEKECTGFIYNTPNQCTLLKGDIIVPKDSSISYSSDLDATLYVKNMENVKFEDLIFLTTNPWHFNGRYWLVNKSDTFAQIIPYNVTMINFYPKYIKMHSEKTGIYCTHPFTAGDIPDLLQYNTCYIHEPGAPLEVPLTYKDGPIYVTYI